MPPSGTPAQPRPFEPGPPGAGQASSAGLLEKVLAAERNVAAIRFAVILLNSLVYLLFMDRAGTIPWLAYTIIGLATSYAVAVLVAEPYRRYPVLRSSIFTSTTDAGLIALWIYATGGFASPFYVLWYVSIVAIAFRFSPRTTIVVSIGYAATYTALLLLLGEVAGRADDVLVRNAYVLFVGAMGALLSREAANQHAARARISERLQEAQRAEVRFRGLIEAAPDAMLIVDETERIHLVNTRAEELFGRPRTDLVNEPLHQFLPEGLGPLRMDSGAPGRGSVGSETGLLAVRGDGETIPVEVRVSPVAYSGSDSFVVAIRDLTSREDRTNELRLVHGTVVAVNATATFDEALQVAVRSICESTGWSVGEAWVARGDPSRLECHHTWARDPARVRPFLDASRGLRLKLDQGLVGSAWTSKRTVWMSDVATMDRFVRREPARASGLHTGVAIPVLVDGQPVAVLCFYLDAVRESDERFTSIVNTIAAQLGAILERRLAEERVQRASRETQLILEAAGEGIFGIDATGRLTFINPAAQRMLQWAEGPRVGTFFHDLIHPNRPDGSPCTWTGCPIHATVAEGRPHRALHDAFQREGADPLPVEYVSTPIRDAEGRILGAVVVFDDVTERMHLEKEASEVQAREEELRRLREIDEFKTQFINTAAHELGTPLTPIKLQLHLLKKSLPDAEGPQQRALGILDRNVERLVNLVHDVLDGARLQAGRLRVVREPVDLTRVVDEAVESFQEPARHAGVKMALQADPGALVNGDANRLTQVLFNLLSNALKFTPAGGSIDVRIEARGDRVVVVVRDTGTGMTPDQMERLFRPFSQVHDQTQSTRTGTGLGLYISKGIVELHEGRIRVESPGPGKGCTFTVDLPLHRGPPAERGEDGARRDLRKTEEAFDQRVRELI